MGDAFSVPQQYRGDGTRAGEYEAAARIVAMESTQGENGWGSGFV